MKKYLVPLLAFLFVLLLSACTDDSEVEEAVEDDNTDAEEAGSGDEITMSVLATPNSLDPHAANDQSSNHVNVNIYDRLVEFTPDLDLEPGLAESYEQIDDLTWEFKLREGIQFHDGTEFNAEAVKANLDRVRDEEVGAPVAFLFELIDSVEVVDEYTVHIKTVHPFAALPSHLAHPAGSMISPAVIEADYEQYENGGELLTEVHQNPVGTGPYTFEELAEGEFVTLSRNEDYWGEPAQAETFTFKAVPEDSTRIAELMTETTDLIYPVNPNDYAQIEDNAGTKMNETESVRMEYVGFNTDKAPFDDPIVRKAIAMAIDKQAIIDEMLEGRAQVADTLLAPAVFGHSDDLDTIEYDTAAAKQMLEENGYGDGFTAEITVMDRTAADMAAYIQEALADLNIDLEIYQLDSGAFLDYVGGGDHEMFIGGWGTVTLDADYGLYALFHSSNIGTSGNRSRYQNSEVDALLDEARSETDPEQRLALYEETQQILLDESPVIPIYHPSLLTGMRDDIEGYGQHPASFHFLKEVHEE
ncbi:glutathione ABC transporter substrate-binding protein [Salinicoccus cyprini]|uniref:Glutathione ABC transporter substrate-binding protein n=1 Tax=Salinicoccus cyprini TaxID=2493691 RepID=A0A558AUE0_9STAP|nr:glutathione ABC transporter substrate-binding protein [Salinicoccus cyprini]TVT27786.1 glutathione ABC transporter substrate-binding protein [Salinicoccus cyprini]